jgi:hypothetical protein
MLRADGAALLVAARGQIKRAIIAALILSPATTTAQELADHPAPTKDDLTTLFDGLMPPQESFLRWRNQSSPREPHQS